jgi:hypothetical protein
MSLAVQSAIDATKPPPQPGVLEKTLSAVRSGAPMWIADAAIHK